MLTVTDAATEYLADQLRVLGRCHQHLAALGAFFRLQAKKRDRADPGVTAVQSTRRYGGVG